MQFSAEKYEKQSSYVIQSTEYNNLLHVHKVRAQSEKLLKGVNIHGLTLNVMEFSKAFDKVDHNKLIYKLSALGIHHLTTLWIKLCLQCRTIQVRIDWCTSATLPVVSGSPPPRVCIGSMPFPCIYK